MKNIKSYDFDRKARRDDSITNTFTEDHLDIVSENFDSVKEDWANGILNEDFQHIQLREAVSYTHLTLPTTPYV